MEELEIFSIQKFQVQFDNVMKMAFTTYQVVLVILQNHMVYQLSLLLWHLGIAVNKQNQLISWKGWGTCIIGETFSFLPSISPVVKSFTPFTCVFVVWLLITGQIPVHISILSTHFWMMSFKGVVWWHSFCLSKSTIVWYFLRSTADLLSGVFQ